MSSNGHDSSEEGRFAAAVNRHPGLVAERLARYAWAASLADDAVVLDAGCGIGWGTAKLAERARRAVGVDLSPPAVVAAARAHGAAAEFHQADLCDLPFEDAEFDLVVCFETIERVERPGRAFDELRRVLKPAGVLLISAANRDAYPPGNPFHLHELDAAELREALTARFARVAVHRQHAYFASLLAGDEDLALDDPSRRLDVAVHKLAGERPEDALFSLVAASDGKLPPPPGRLVVGHGIDHEERRRLTEAWRERALQAESTAAAISIEMSFLDERLEAALERAEAAERALAEASER